MIKKASINIPYTLNERIDKSREAHIQTKGKKPTLTDWFLEAAAEKLARESKQARTNA
ncbi:hypothetical protein [Vibrio sp. ER1A]|uniref:hypothetical protein n=1 Tax=Vibrio sp. ER1A TaxID=1517681 RepID=UPI000B22B0D9|nr:hypothetical protein [Vibrio sp. ER1A]